MIEICHLLYRADWSWNAINTFDSLLPTTYKRLNNLLGSLSQSMVLGTEGEDDSFDTVQVLQCL